MRSKTPPLHIDYRPPSARVRRRVRVRNLKRFGLFCVGLIAAITIICILTKNYTFLKNIFEDRFNALQSHLTYWLK